MGKEDIELEDQNILKHIYKKLSLIYKDPFPRNHSLTNHSLNVYIEEQVSLK